MKTTTKILVIAVLTGIMYFLPTQGNELFAQRNGKGNGTCLAQNQQTGCLSIPGITEDQKQKIQDLQTTHQHEMKVLRDEKRSTRSMEVKNAVDEKMTAKIDAHKKAIRVLLTPEQQKYYDENCTQTKRVHRNKGFKNGNGQGNGTRCQNR
ncbi:MAG: Spy/CpxP family protein refolding chaperone [Bacteroidales bacterium]|nr:Spy/CpxP family protein refolding chaperone [Bacteroidales bacterium]MCF8457623.1 Spy/CpxP family protein refolding chaperone [Bacteroidales bacterium]